MSGGHAHQLYRPGSSVVHRLAPQCKLAAVVTFVLVVVATPARQYWAFGCYAVLLATVAALARIPAPVVVRRMAVEVPFVLFAVLLPVISSGPRVDVLGVSLSQSGLVGAWTVLAKGTLGVVASILLAATTDARDLLRGLQQLRMPSLMVQIMTFMLRYSEVIAAEMHRMRVARESRAFQGRDIRQLRTVTASAGALFIRSYERGERVHLAMLSRGYTGSLPVVDDARAAASSWLTAAVLPAAAAAVAMSAWVVQR